MRNDDKLDTQIGAALRKRASLPGDAGPTAESRARIEQRAATLRRRRAGGRALAAVVVVGLFGGAMALPGDDGAVTVAGPGDPGAGATPAPGADFRYLIPDRPLAPESAGATAVVKAGPGTYEIQAFESDPADPTRARPVEGKTESVEFDVQPLLHVRHDTGPNHYYRLDRSEWPATTTSWPVTAVDDRTTRSPEHDFPGLAELTVITGQGFDPGRLSADTPTETGATSPSGRRELHLRPADLPPTTIGSRQAVVLPKSCSPQGAAEQRCRTSIVGGDADHVLVLTLSGVPSELDPSAILAGLQSVTRERWEAAVGTTGDDIMATANSFATERKMDSTPPGSVPPRDESAWPAEVPADFCTAYRQWMQIQMDVVPSFGAQGWIRWADRLAELAPPDLGPSFTVIADIERAGGDASVDQPGADALTRILAGSDPLCGR